MNSKYFKFLASFCIITFFSGFVSGSLSDGYNSDLQANQEFKISSNQNGLEIHTINYL